MRALRAWCLRFAALFHKEQRDLELAEELVTATIANAKRSDATVTDSGNKIQ